MSLFVDKLVAGINKILFEPIFFEDRRYKVWVCALSPTTCRPCFKLHGKIFLPSEAPSGHIKLHPRCGCSVIWLKSIKKGTVSFEGKNGIDVLLLEGHPLPDNYITKAQAKELGWKPILMNLHQITNNGIIGGDVYKNRDEKLPNKNGRIWFEADINYTGGARNGSRIVYSNDGLVFVTYDHYLTFNEIR